MKAGVDNILVMKNITKQFPGVLALNNVTFSVERNSVHALVGENGAGKSTLMKILSGMYTEYEGEILIEGKQMRFANERDALEAGVAVVSQELNLVSELTVAENIFLGREPVRKVKSFLAKDELKRNADKLLESMGLNFSANAKIFELSVAQRQLVEIIKAISRNARIVVMDEPSSALTDVEIQYLFKQIEKLKNQGITIIYISHKLDEIMAVCDRITVLRDGQLIGSEDVCNLETGKIIHMMVGRELTEIYPSLPPAGTEPVLEVSHLYRKGEFEDVSFTVNKGEILGISGMMGAGRSEVAKSIFHLTIPDTGVIKLSGKVLNIKKTGDAIKKGIVMVTEDRAMYGFVGVRSIKDNILLANCDRFAPKLFIRRKQIAQSVQEICSKLAVKAPNMDTSVSSLSGGNQQKVVLAKWLIRNIKVLIMDEPTRGIDVGAKHEIYKLIASLAEQGIAVIMISSELPEIIALSHRAIVMADGKIKGELSKDEIRQEKVMNLILGK